MDRDNHRPRFSPINGAFGNMMEVSFESNRNGSWDIYTAHGYADSTSIQWTDRGVSETPGSVNHTDYRDGTLYYWPYITTGAAKISAFPEIAGVCVAGSDQGDSVALLEWYDAITYQNTSAGSISRNPALSRGLFFNSSKVRIMAVWENNSTGGWKLYSSSIDLQIAGVDDEPGLPASALLYQNYPNPFNPTTAITYRLSTGGVVTLRVYDILGRKVATLVNEWKVPGTYTVRWDAGGEASGTYICRMTAGAFSAVTKVLLLR